MCYDSRNEFQNVLLSFFLFCVVGRVIFLADSRMKQKRSDSTYDRRKVATTAQCKETINDKAIVQIEHQSHSAFIHTSKGDEIAHGDVCNAGREQDPAPKVQLRDHIEASIVSPKLCIEEIREELVDSVAFRPDDK